MKRKKILNLAFLAFFSLVSLQSICQNAISVSSHSATINGLKFEYTVGEMTLISTERNANLIVTQGLLQPNSSGSGADLPPGQTPADISEMIRVYPNPTENILFVESIENADAAITYQLFDAS